MHFRVTQGMKQRNGELVESVPGVFESNDNLRIIVKTADAPTKRNQVIKPFEEYAKECVANADKSYRDRIEHGFNMAREKRANLIRRLLKNKRNTFTEEELNQMGMKMLEQVSKISGANEDYGVRPTPKLGQNKKSEDDSDAPPIPRDPFAKWRPLKPEVKFNRNGVPLPPDPFWRLRKK